MSKRAQNDQVVRSSEKDTKYGHGAKISTKLGYLKATSDYLEKARGRQARGCKYVLKAEDDFDQSAHSVIMI